MPPPTSGGVAVGQILGMLEARDLAALAPVGTPAAIPLLGVHLFAEASRLAYADRDRYLADPDFVDVPVAALLDPAYLKRRGATIADDRAMGHAEAGSFGGRQARRGDDASLELPSTSHLVAVDNEGNAVSMTASIENAFGSRLLVHGFLLNNELTDFSFVPERDGAPVANRVQPGKRPRSSMAPFLVLGPDGRFFAAVGSPGGSRIIGYVARTLIAMLDWGLDPQQAVALPHVQNRNGATELESVAGQEAWTKRTEQGLVALGHEVVVQDLNSGLQAVVRRGAGYVGGADPRREGSIAAD